MKIVLAEHFGMCFGVRDAIAQAEQLAEQAPLTILGELVHNPIVRERLRAQGVQEATIGGINNSAIESNSAAVAMITENGVRPSPQSSQRSAQSRSQPRARSAGEGSVFGSNCLIFGLPGNPVSAFVTFLQFVRPAILRMMGATNLDLPQVSAKLALGLTNDGDRPHYIRGRLEDGKFMPIGRQESHALFGLSRANALLRVAAGQALKADEIVDVQIWD